MKKVLAALAVFALLLGAVPAMAHTADDPLVVPLYAGQDIPVGNVLVWNDASNTYFKYILDPPWCMTESHLDVETDPDNFPQKNGNPVPGQFEYSTEHAPCVTEYTYSVPLTWDIGTKIYVAAHAAVERVLKESPYPAATVVSYDQGLKKDGSPVRTERSVPEQGLAYETGRDETNFFSLGFGGYIVVGFDCPIPNRGGNEVKVVEDTWGPGYPLEQAAVYASQDGENWTSLGIADNTKQDGIHTISEFDLDGLEWAKYIKIVDTTDPTIHNNAADGYDLNAVLALQDCKQEETAWGAGYDFTGRNWATYFTYTVQCPYEPGLVNGGFESPVVTGDPWGIFTSGDVGWTVEWAGTYEGAPADPYLEIHTSGTVVSSYEGNQYVELDTDWEGVGSPGGEQASVRIYQDLATCPGQEYTLTYAWRGRPGYESAIAVSFGDYSAKNHADSSGQWNFVEVTATADDWTTRLEFVETGPADSYGMFLDAVAVTKN